jgi:hypothetical protein
MPPKEKFLGPVVRYLVCALIAYALLVLFSWIGTLGATGGTVQAFALHCFVTRACRAPS